MDEAIVQQIVDELLSSLEPLETQNAALLQFLKARGIATDEELAPFLEQAGNASNIRWRAVRVRTAALISSAMKPAEQPVETAPAIDTQHKPESSKKNPENENTGKEKAQKPESRQEEPVPAKNESSQLQQQTQEKVTEPRPTSQKADESVHSPSTSRKEDRKEDRKEEKTQTPPDTDAPAPETQKEKAA